MEAGAVAGVAGAGTGGFAAACFFFDVVGWPGITSGPLLPQAASSDMANASSSAKRNERSISNPEF